MGDELQNLCKLIEKHATENEYAMDSNSIVNFLDHISGLGDGCGDCSKAMEQYTGNEVTRND